MVTNEELEKDKNRVDKYVLELEGLKSEYRTSNHKLGLAVYDSNNGIERARPVQEELTPVVIKLKEQIETTESDLNESIKIYESTKKEYNKITEKIRHNRQTKLEAINDKKPYTDEEITMIFLGCNLPWGDFLNDEIEFYRKKLKRTYLAVEAFVRLKQVYEETGEIREFYYEDSGNISSTGAQVERILDKLIKDKKI